MYVHPLCRPATRVQPSTSTCLSQHPAHACLLCVVLKTPVRAQGWTHGSCGQQGHSNQLLHACPVHTPPCLPFFCAGLGARVARATRAQPSPSSALMRSATPQIWSRPSRRAAPRCRRTCRCVWLSVCACGLLAGLMSACVSRLGAGHASDSAVQPNACSHGVHSLQGDVCQPCWWP